MSVFVLLSIVSYRVLGLRLWWRQDRTYGFRVGLEEEGGLFQVGLGGWEVRHFGVCVVDADGLGGGDGGGRCWRCGLEGAVVEVGLGSRSIYGGPQWWVPSMLGSRIPSLAHTSSS